MLLIDLRVLDDHFPGIARYAYELTLALLRAPEAPPLALLLPKQPRTRLDLAPLAQADHLLLTDASVFGLRQVVELPYLARKVGATAAIFPYYVRPPWMPCPSLTMILDTISWRVPEAFSRSKRLQIQLFHRLAIATSKRIATLSRSSAADVAQFYGVAPAKLVVTSAAAAAHFRPQSAAALAEYRARAGLPERYLVYLASDKPHKNIPFLLAAWAQAEHHGSALVLAGRWFDPASEALVAAQGRDVIRLPSPSEADLPLLYAGARALAFPSRYEGFGLPPLEAMACGTPVLAARTSSLPEVLGAAGLLLPLELDAWAQALGRAAGDDSWRAAAAADALRQAAHFDWDRVADQVLAGVAALQP